MAADRITVTACEAVLLDLLAQVRKFCAEQGEAEFTTGAAEAMKRRILGMQCEPHMERQLEKLLAAYGVPAAHQISGSKNSSTSPDGVAVGAPGATDAERAAWLADKIVALGDYAKEAAAMLRRWPHGVLEAPAPEPCPRGADKPEPTCTNRHQCWEPCGELGKSEEHVRVGRDDPSKSAGGVDLPDGGQR